MAGKFMLLQGGKFLTAPGGKFAVDPACCCDPCTNCAAATPNATVTVDGPCDDTWGTCADAAGNYTFNSFSAGGTACAWYLKRIVAGGYYDLRIYHNSATNLWTGHLRYMVGEPPAATDLFDRQGIPVVCSGGARSGTFQLDGLPMAGCDGCTATVTLT